jgi:hypothetical protein
VPIDDIVDEVIELLACHESQVFEWLPHMMGLIVDKQRTSWLKEFYGRYSEAVASRYAERGVRYAEAYELSEYGRQIQPDKLSKLLSAGA